MLKYDRLFYAATTYSKQSLLSFFFSCTSLTTVLGHERLEVNFLHPLNTACRKLRSRFRFKQCPKTFISCHVRGDAGVRLKSKISRLKRRCRSSLPRYSDVRDIKNVSCLSSLISLISAFRWLSWLIIGLSCGRS